MTTSADPFICFAINQFGDGQHPMADQSTLDGFADDYIRLCIQRALDSGKISDAAAQLARNLLQEDF
jgi:hypothetical protein